MKCFFLNAVIIQSFREGACVTSIVTEKPIVFLLICIDFYSCAMKQTANILPSFYNDFKFYDCYFTLFVESTYKNRWTVLFIKSF